MEFNNIRVEIIGLYYSEILKVIHNLPFTVSYTADFWEYDKRYTFILKFDKFTDDINRICSIPKAIINIYICSKNLKITKINKIPFKIKGIGNYGYILDLSKNNISKIENIPHEIIELNLSKNQIKKIPNKLYEFRTLNKLDLSQNKISSTYNIFDMSMHDLNLSNNRITKVILQACEIKGSLNLSNNIITKVSNLGNCRELKYLDLSNNLLTEIPRYLKYCIRLEILNLSNNRINSISRLNKCHFKYINLSNNNYLRIANLQIIWMTNTQFKDFYNNMKNIKRQINKLKF